MRAEFERSLIRERTHAGLAAARAIGPSGGRKPKLGEETGVGNQGADTQPGNSRGRRGEALWGIANYALQTCRRYRPEEPMSAVGLPAHVRNSRHPARETTSTFEGTCLSAAEKMRVVKNHKDYKHIAVDPELAGLRTLKGRQ